MQVGPKASRDQQYKHKAKQEPVCPVHCRQRLASQGALEAPYADISVGFAWPQHTVWEVRRVDCVWKILQNQVTFRVRPEEQVSEDEERDECKTLPV